MVRPGISTAPGFLTGTAGAAPAGTATAAPRARAGPRSATGAAAAAALPLPVDGLRSGLCGSAAHHGDVFFKGLMVCPAHSTTGEQHTTRKEPCTDWHPEVTIIHGRGGGTPVMPRDPRSSTSGQSEIPPVHFRGCGAPCSARGRCPTGLTVRCQSMCGRACPTNRRPAFEGHQVKRPVAR